MAKRKARVVWIPASFIPKKGMVSSASWMTLYGEQAKAHDGDDQRCNCVRFVESPPRKKARKKK